MDSLLIMINFYRKIVLSVALLVICQAGFSQKTPLPETFLWRISGNGLSKPSFLYGTVHLSDKKLFYFGDSLYRCLEQAEGFNIELDADSMINASIRRWSQNDNGRLLKALMNKKEYDKYADKLSRTLGKPADKITTKDIWLAKNGKSAEAYKKGNMQSFMDLYLYGIAKKQGKKVGGIEDVEDQLSIIDDFFDEMDVAYVTSDTSLETGTGMVERMKKIYIKQDLSEMQSLIEGSMNAKLRDIVLTKRNLKMARRMDSLARQRSSFFAVGVAHLPGDTGVINLLKRRGFTVEPVFSSKKIAPENYSYQTVDIPWLSYMHDLHLYQVEAPGMLQPMDVMKEAMDMEYYYDVSNGKVYYTAVVNSAADINKKDSVFTDMISRMASGNRTLLSQKKIIKQNYEGRDVILKATENQLLHFNVYMAEGYAYLAMILCKKSEENDIDSRRFLESFTMTPTASVSRPYIRYNDTTLAFSIKLPQQPIINEESDSGDGGGDLKVFSATDFSSGNSYSVTVRNTKAGNYIPSDSNYLEQIKANLVALMKEDTVTEITTYKEHPALKMKGSAKAENIYYQTLAILRGNRSYFLLAQSKKPITTNALTDSFFHSFVLNDYTTGQWENYTSTDHSFTGWLPAAVIEKDEENIPVDTLAFISDRSLVSPKENVAVKNSYLFNDKSTGTSYNVEREELSDYYFSVNDSTFFSEASLKFRNEGDSIISFTRLNVGKDKAADVQIKHANSSITKKIRFILHGDTLYKIFTFTPIWLAANTNTQKFFNQFSIISTSSPSTLFTNKTSKLITDLTSPDSASFYKASNYLYDATLHKSDLQTFYPLLIKPLKDFAESPYNTNNKLINAMADMADSSTVHFVAQHYHMLKNEEQKLQYSLLKLLVKMKQPYADESALELLHSPNAPAGNTGIFASELRNNLPLAKKMFPTIIGFTKDSTAALEYAYLITTLLDSNYISKKDVLPYLDNFITTASQQKNKIKTNDDEYHYALSSVFDLFGTLNDTVTNAKLQEYSTINNLYLKYNAVTWLLKNAQSLPLDAINKLASSDEYRSLIYDTLRNANKTAVFPAAHRSQKLFAASYIYNYAAEDDDIVPSSVKYMTEKTATFRGKKLKFYLFKVSFGEGEDATHSLGIAGPFSFSGSEITSNNEATGIYWKEDYSAKEINNQFNEYLKQKSTMEE